MRYYSGEDLKAAGLYEDTVLKVEGEIRSGKVRSVPDLLKLRLDKIGGGRYRDPSREDSSIITSLIRCGFNPSDAYATFAISPRGLDAISRKNSHFDDYLQRTIRASLSYVGKTLEDYKPRPAQAPTNGSISVDFSKKRPYKLVEGINLAQASRIEVEKVNWLWKGYIPLGKITILAGDPGMGKSTIGIDLVARVSRGGELPTGGRTISGNCLIASAEDAAGDTITPRLIIAKANMKRVSIIQEVVTEDQASILSLPRDLDKLRKVVADTGARLVVIDPLNAFLDRGTDSHKDQDIRTVLAPISYLAEETGAAILLIAHLNKKEDTLNTLYRVGGSIGFTGAARSVLNVRRDEKTNVLYSGKQNLGPAPPSLKYQTKSQSRQRVNDAEWKGEKKVSTVGIKWMGQDDSNSSHTYLESEGKSFLKQVITDSKVCSDDIFRESRKAGISRDQLFQGKDELKVKVTRGRDGLWYWELP
jgi:archaellum biogenesis ATPase FlaH